MIFCVLSKWSKTINTKSLTLIDFADSIGIYYTSRVGSHWAGKPITLGLTEEIVDGRAQKWAALLLLTYQL